MAYSNTEILKNVKLEYKDALDFVKDSDRLFIGLLPLIDFSVNPSAVRTEVGKRLIQIVTWCKPRNVKVCAILPTQDIQYYAGLFNLAGIETWCMANADILPTEILTDHYFIAAGDAETVPIYNACSCVFVIQPAQLEEDFPIMDTIENDQLVFFNVPAVGQISFIDEGSPSNILQDYKKANKPRIKGDDPYSVFPSLDDNIVRRIKRDFYQELIDAMPQHALPRRLTTASNEEFKVGDVVDYLGIRATIQSIKKNGSISIGYEGRGLKEGEYIIKVVPKAYLKPRSK